MTEIARRHLALGLLLAVAACGSSAPTRFYLLSPAAPVAVPTASGPIVHVDPASVAPYLDRAQLVTRVEPDQVAFADTRTWAEPLSGMVTRYVVDALGDRFGPGRVMETPSGGEPVAAFRLTLAVLRFDGDQAGSMVVDIRWTLLTGRDGRFVATGRERVTEAATDPAAWDARVAALGRALGRFADRLGAAVAQQRTAAG